MEELIQFSDEKEAAELKVLLESAGIRPEVEFCSGFSVVSGSVPIKQGAGRIMVEERDLAAAAKILEDRLGQEAMDDSLIAEDDATVPQVGADDLEKKLREKKRLQILAGRKTLSLSIGMFCFGLGFYLLYRGYWKPAFVPAILGAVSLFQWKAGVRAEKRLREM